MAFVQGSQLNPATSFNPSATSIPSGPEIGNNITRNTTILPTVTVTASRITKPAIGVNILNKYRSYTYNFVLAGLDSAALSNPTYDQFNNSSKHLVILNSAGKGTSSGITTVTENTKTVDSTDGSVASKLTAGFNKKSPGRFDMFIDNVEIETIMAFTPETNTTLPTSIKFEVYEPYSINGFIEALQVAAVAAGYATYAQATFLLKMSFSGYPDDPGTPSAVQEIDGGTRYFVLMFTGIEVEITEKGTRYRCAAVPPADIALGSVEGGLKQPIQVVGKKVGDILTNFMTELESQRKTAADDAKVKPKDYDRYNIIFPKPDGTGGVDYSNTNTNITNVDFVINLKDNKIFQFDDAQTSNKSGAYKVETPSAPTSSDPSVSRSAPTSGAVVSFSDRSSIYECISSVIADSDYTRNLISTIGQANNPDQYGMVDYFLIKLETSNRKIINDQTKKPYQNYTYVVTPYKVHYTSIPNYADQNFPFDKLQSRVLRNYNYIYTGKNIDVLNFKLNFNTLFFEAIPNAMGNNDQLSDKTAAASDGSLVVKKQTRNIEEIQNDLNPPPGQYPYSPSTRDSNQGRPPAGQQQEDPYWVLARSMHNAITNSNASMLTGDIDIMGDPYYLATGGIGNYRPKSESPGNNTDGSVDHNYGQVLVQINFKNPVDIAPLNNGGLLQFNPEQVPFSGIYMITKVVSHFKEGMFKQNLSVVRKAQTDLTGQDTNNPETAQTTPAVSTEPSKQNIVTSDANKNSTENTNITYNV